MNLPTKLQCLSRGCDGTLIEVSTYCCGKIFRCQKCGKKMILSRKYLNWISRQHQHQ